MKESYYLYPPPSTACYMPPLILSPLPCLVYLSALVLSPCLVLCWLTLLCCWYCLLRCRFVLPVTNIHIHPHPPLTDIRTTRRANLNSCYKLLLFKIKQTREDLKVNKKGGIRVQKTIKKGYKGQEEWDKGKKFKKG